MGSPSIKPTEELSAMPYSEYEKSVSDERAPSPKSSKKVLKDREIIRRNLTPEKAVELIDSGYVISLHRSLRDEVPLITLLFLSICITTAVSIYFPVTTDGFPTQVFGPLVIIALLFHRRWNAKYFLEKDGITLVKGILLIHLSRLKCDYEKVKVVEVQKNLLQRILNVGDVRISTALVNQPEMSLDGLSNPYFYAGIVKLRIKEIDLNKKDGGGK